MSTGLLARAADFRRHFRVFLACLALSSLCVSLPVAGQERAYITNRNSDDVTVIDLATGTVVATIPVGGVPVGVAVSNGPLVYVANARSRSVSVIDTATLTAVDTIAGGGFSPFALAIHPDDTRLYSVNGVSDTVSVIDTASRAVVATVPVGDGPQGLVATADGQWVYVANLEGDDVSIISTATNTVVATVAVGNQPLAIVEAPGRQRVYVANKITQNLSVIDTTTQSVVDTWPLGAMVSGVVISPDESRLYFAAQNVDQLRVVDLATGTVTGSVGVNDIPYGIDVTPDGTRVYVANYGAVPGNVSVIDTATLTVVDTITVGDGPIAFGEFISSFVPTPPEGVNLSTPTAPVTYAREIRATPAAPAALDNTAGDLNLTVGLGYSFSPDETRYARIECPGLVFDDDAEAVHVGGGSASVGALNGLNSHAIHFSITADDASVGADGLLTVTGGRLITGTDPVDCTYGLYDFPSQAAGGGSHGRVATASGAYLEFAPSTVFTATGLTAVADVEADPAFSAFIASGPTTAATAALAELQYGLATPAPLQPDGTTITLSDLHATGTDGTRIVAEGDFSAAANADGSYTGDALERVYLSGDDASCTPVGGLAASTLSATHAEFPVGDVATDALLCLAPLAGTPIPVADYSASLVAVSAAPSDYAVDDIDALDAGAITRNGTQLQAPLAQLPEGWVSRLVLTNTGTLDRPYAIAVSGETGNLIGTANLTGVVPARGTVVIDLDEVLVSFSGKSRATINVTVAGPNAQIQGQYQIVNPGSGALSNHVMVRPGTN